MVGSLGFTEEAFEQVGLGCLGEVSHGVEEDGVENDAVDGFENEADGDVYQEKR